MTGLFLQAFDTEGDQRRAYIGDQVNGQCQNHEKLCHQLPACKPLQAVGARISCRKGCHVQDQEDQQGEAAHSSCPEDEVLPDVGDTCFTGRPDGIRCQLCPDQSVEDYKCHGGACRMLKGVAPHSVKLKASHDAVGKKEGHDEDRQYSIPFSH